MVLLSSDLASLARDRNKKLERMEEELQQQKQSDDLRLRQVREQLKELQDENQKIQKVRLKGWYSCRLILVYTFRILTPKRLILVN